MQFKINMALMIVLVMFFFALVGCGQSSSKKKSKNSSDAVSEKVVGTDDEEDVDVNDEDTENALDENNDDDDDDDDDEDRDLENDDEDSIDEGLYLLLDGKQRSYIQALAKGRNDSYELRIKNSDSDDKYVILSVDYDHETDLSFNIEDYMKSKTILTINALRNQVETGRLRVNVRNMTKCEKLNETDCGDAGEESEYDSYVSLKVKPVDADILAAEAKKKAELLKTGLEVLGQIGVILEQNAQNSDEEFCD